MLSPVASAAVAIVIAAAGTVFYSLGLGKQHRSVEGQAEGVGIRQFLGLLKNPGWLLGALGVGGSAACHLTALTLAPIQIVQPIGILGIIWSVLLEDRRRGSASSKALWAAVLTCAGALLCFILAATSRATVAAPLHVRNVLFAVVPIALVSVVFALVGMRSRWQTHKSLLCAASAACAYGLATGLIKVALVALGRYGLANWWPWACVAGLAIIYPVAGWVLQQAFGAGAVSIAVGTMTTTDPVMAVIFGLIALGEGALITPVHGTIMVISGLIAIASVVVLSRLRQTL